MTRFLFFLWLVTMMFGTNAAAAQVLTPLSSPRHLDTETGGADVGYSPQMLIAAWNDVNRKPAHYNGVREGNEFFADNKTINGYPWRLITAWYMPPGRKTMGIFDGPSIDYLFALTLPAKNSPPLESTMFIFAYSLENFKTADHDHWCGKDLVGYFSRLPSKKNSIAYQNVIYTLCRGLIMRFDVPGDPKKAKSILVPTNHDLQDDKAYQLYTSNLPQSSFEDYSIDSGEQLPIGISK